MLCAKHGEDITKDKDKEQIAEVWLCRQAIWETQTVHNLMTSKTLQDEYTNQIVAIAKADALEEFIATKPTKEQIVDFVKLYS